MFQQSFNQYLESMRQPRNLVDIALVFLLVYSLLRAIRGTRAAPMAAGLGALALLYLAAVRYDLSTLESILRLSDRKSTRLNSSHANISYAVFCLKKKKQ